MKFLRRQEFLCLLRHVLATARLSGGSFSGIKQQAAAKHSQVKLLGGCLEEASSCCAGKGFGRQSSWRHLHASFWLLLPVQK
jgi:hypothetical protein